MAVYEYKGYIPVIHESSYVHPLAAVIGEVTIGKNVYVGPGASIRGDFGEIIVEDGCNVQDNCILHMFPGIKVHLKENAHIGHGAIIHSATIGINALVGMNAVVMDHCIVGDESIIGAQAFVPESTEIPSRKVAVGNPAKVVKDVTDEMLTWKTKGTELYQTLPKACQDTLKEVEPLRMAQKFKRTQERLFETWGKTNED